MGRSNKKEDYNSQKCLQQYVQPTNEQKTLNKNKEEANENICVVDLIVRGRKLDGVRDNGKKTGGDGDVVLEKDDENTMDSQEN